MLLPERELTSRARIRTFAIWQFPTVMFAAMVAAVVGLLKPALLANGHSQVGFAVVVAASALAVAVPWERVGLNWRVCVPLLDVLAVALLRYDLYADLPSIGLVVVLPLIWLAFDFGWVGMGSAVVGAVFVTTYPYLLDHRAPASGLSWAQVLLLPTAAVVLTVVTQVVVRVLEHNRGELLARSAETADALQRISDHAVLSEGILETIDAAVVYYDDSGDLQMSNQLAERFARRAGLILDRAPHLGAAIWHEDKRTPVPPEEQVIPRALAGETIPGVVQWLGSLGDQVAVQWSARRLYQPDGRLVGTVVGWWDVTELVDAVEVRDDFLATVSHELRTPLTSIIGYLELIQEQVETIANPPSDAMQSTRPRGAGAHVEQPSAAARELLLPLATVRRNATILLERIALLLAASEARSMKLSTVPTDLRELVVSTLAKHQPSADAADVSLCLADTDSGQGDGGDFDASVDPAKLEQALDNLISNALKYTLAGGAVVIALRSSSAAVSVQVSDTGVGMSPSEQRQAFDRFFRAESARRSATQGIGLGLTIVKEIIDAHRGTLEVRSESGRGTCFTIRLPRLGAASKDLGQM